MLSDKTRGRLFLVGLAGFWLYYTFWSLMLPLFDPNNPIHEYFPAREWALRVPAVILLSGMTAIGALAGITMIDGHPQHV